MFFHTCHLCYLPEGPPLTLDMPLILPYDTWKCLDIHIQPSLAVLTLSIFISQILTDAFCCIQTPSQGMMRKRVPDLKLTRISTFLGYKS